MTLTFSRLSSAFCWLGDGSSSAMRTLKPVSLLARPSSSALPLPMCQLGSTWRRFCHSRHDVGAGRRREVGELRQRVLGGPAVVAAGVDRDQERLLGGRCEIDQPGVAHGRLKCSPGDRPSFVPTIPLGAANLALWADQAQNLTLRAADMCVGEATVPPTRRA
jgi:hypothetical protein